MGNWRGITAILVGLLLSDAAAIAAPACGPYMVGLFEYGVVYYRGDDGRYQGVDADLVADLAKRSGCTLNTVLESRARIWSQLADGRLDLTTSAVPTVERERYLEFVPYLRSRAFVWLRRELAGTLPTPEAFLKDPERRLLVLRGITFSAQLTQWIEQLRARHRLIEAADQPAALRAIKAGRVDAMLVGATTLSLSRKRDPALDEFIAQDWAPQDRVLIGLALSREKVSLADRARLRRAMDAMVQDGGLDAILRRHLDEASLRALREPLEPAAGVRP